MTIISITLPDQLAEEAAQAGLLASERIETLHREQLQLRAARLARLRTVREHLAADPVPPMTAAEIQAKIDDYRAARRAPGAC